MKKISFIIIVFTLLIFCASALASDAVMFFDEELGFSFLMPEDFEYYGDYCDEAEYSSGAQNIEKQPMYVGWDANVNVVYSVDEEEFDKLEARMPSGTAADELDFYMFSEKERDQFRKSVINGLEQTGLDNEIKSSEWEEYGGKLCLLITMQGYSPDFELDYYQASLSFIYRRYFISVTYTKFNVSGNVSYDEALFDFEDCFSSLEFEAVPTNKDSKLSGGGIDWVKTVIWAVCIAAAAGIAALILVLMKRKKAKR